MDHPSLDQFLARGKAVLAKGPVAMIFIEDGIEVESTLSHHLNAGFRAVLAFLPPQAPAPDLTDPRLTLIRYDTHADGSLPVAVNAVIAAAPPGTWLYYCYNAEYLFHPFCETRTVGEMLAFHAEERRDAMLTYVIDLYAGDLTRHPGAVSLEDAMLDGAGYYALARHGAEGQALDRQLDFYGGLRWRFEEHIPWARRRIDRIGLFRAKKGLRLLPDHRFDDEEYNTYACPWHHNLTSVIASFRTAKALRTNPGSKYAVHNFRWRGSVPFDWSSRQLMDLGLMEPGQWF